MTNIVEKMRSWRVTSFIKKKRALATHDTPRFLRIISTSPLITARDVRFFPSESPENTEFQNLPSKFGRGGGKNEVGYTLRPESAFAFFPENITMLTEDPKANPQK